MVKITPSPRRWTVVALLFTGILINYVDRGNLAIAAAPVMREFDLSPAAMGVLLSSFFWTYALLQAPGGYLVDRFGLKWTYAGAFLLWSLASAGIGLARSFEQVLICRLLLGVGEAVAAPAGISYIRTHFRAEEQGLPTSVYLCGMMLGPAAGTLVAAATLAAMGWRMLFIVIGVGCCIWLAPWLALAPEGRPAAAAAHAPVRAARIARNPAMWGIIAGTFFYSYFWYYCLTWLPSYLVTARRFSFLHMGVYTALPLALMAVVSMGAARAADRIIARVGRPFRVRQLFLVAGLGTGSAIVLLPAAESQGAILGVMTLSLFGVGIASANYWALTQAISPKAVIGRVIGFQNMIGNLAGVCSPALTGVVVELPNGYAWSVSLAGGSVLLAAFCYLALVRERAASELREALDPDFTKEATA